MWGFCQIAIGGKTRFTEAPVCIDEIQNASKLAAGQFLSAAIDEAGKVYNWGFNTDGALGRPSEKINSPPGQVELPATKSIVIGDQFMLALSDAGEIYAWGNNSSGQLALGHLDSIARPELIRTSYKIANIAAGSTHALALSEQGEVFGWGSNHYGQIAGERKTGNSRHAYITKPARIPFPEKIASIAAGMHCSIALSSSGNVYTWGWNGCGQLGHGDLQSRSKPTRIAGLSGVRAIASGEMHVLALGQKRLLGWGSNESGQLGKAAVRQMTPYSILES
jgi:alpha-tubulin suppressor-like RCC1 family protein